MKKKLLVYIVSSCIALSSLGQVNYQWVKSVGGFNSDKGTSIATDGSGNVYVAAQLSLASGSSANFDPYGSGSGSFSLSPNQSGNCAIVKYDQAGNCLWTNSFTSDGFADVSFFVTSIAVSDNGSDLYVSGGYQGVINFGSTTLTSSDIKPFIAKYDAGTGTLLWVNDLGFTGVIIKDIIPHPSSSFVYLTGIAGQEAVFGKCDNSNGNLLFVDTLKGLGSIVPYGIALDASSNITLTGSFTGVIDFDPSPITATKTSSGFSDIFIAQYTPGGDYLWANKFGGPLNDIGTSLTFNANGDSIYIAGVFQGGANFGQGSLSVIGANNGFVAKCNNVGGNVLALQQIKTLNATDSIICSGISLDAQDNVYLTGAYLGKANFVDNTSNDTLISNGSFDLFFAKYNEGLTYGWSRSIGGNSADGATDIALYNENIYVTGYYDDSVDFNIGNGFATRTVNQDQSPNSYSDIFILNYALGNATIKGSVYFKDSNNNLDSLKLVSAGKKVRLYTQTQFDGNNALNLIAETDIDNLGKYTFTQVPDGDYLAFALPGDHYSSTEHLIPSYHSSDINNDTAFIWESATIITTASTAPAFVADIRMAKGMPLTGTAKLGGRILADEGYFREVKPVAAGSVVVRRNPGNSIIANTETDSSGFYSFDNLPAVFNDTCYRLYVNIAGLPMVSNYSPRPGQGDSIMNLNFVVDSATIDTVPNGINSVSQMKTESSLTVYPNPNYGSVTIEFETASPQFVSIEVYNMLGKKVANLLNEKSNNGLVRYKYNTAEKGLKAGVYFLNIQIGNERITRKIVQID